MSTGCNGETQTSKEKPFLIFYLPAACLLLHKTTPSSPFIKEKLIQKKSKAKLYAFLSVIELSLNDSTDLEEVHNLSSAVSQMSSSLG